MADDKAIPLPPNSRVHPEPHIPERGFLFIDSTKALILKPCKYHDALIIRQEGPYKVFYYDPPLCTVGKKYYDLTNCVATWIKHEESKTERSN